MRKGISIGLVMALLFALFSPGLTPPVLALVLVDDVIIAVIVAALAAMGIHFLADGVYGSVQEFIGSEFGSFAESRNSTPEALLSGTQNGINRLGQLVLNATGLGVISTFAQYLIAKYNLSNNTITSTGHENGVTIGDLVCYPTPVAFFLSSSSYRQYTVISGTSEVSAYAFACDSGGSKFYPYVVSRDSFTLTYRIYYVNGNISEPTSSAAKSFANGWYVAPGPVHSLNYNPDVVVYSKAQITGALSAYSDIGSDATDYLNIGTGTISVPTEDPSYVDQGALIDIAAPWGIEYQDLVDTYIPATQSGVDDLVGAGSYTLVSDSALSTEVAQSSESMVSQDPAEYQVQGLADVFPFCIPFDLYNFFSCLAADPVAPCFDWRFYVPRICDYTITVDLSGWNTVAAIVRTMELLAFCVGLVLETRKLIRG